MKDIPLKADNVGDTVNASEYNSATSEEKNAITDSGQVLSEADNHQLSKAMAFHASVGDFYVDSGSANNYILTPTGSRPAPSAYYDGMSVRFRAVHGNTGASIVNVSTLGSRAIKQEDGGLDPVADDIPATKVTELIYNAALGVFEVTLNKFADNVAITGSLDFGMYTSRPGWVIMNDGTIGDAASGATTRANADCEALFKLIWTNVSSPWANTYCPVVGGLGASANADWAAHKKITLPRTMGRVLACAGAGSGLSTRYLGTHLGEETHTLLYTENGQHVHVISDPSHAHSSGVNEPRDIDLSGDKGNSVVSGTTSWNVTGVSTGYSPATATEPHNNMQPTTVFEWFIKL